jgi:hypothetical protein
VDDLASAAAPLASPLDAAIVPADVAGVADAEQVDQIDDRAASDAAAQRAFSTSILVSATRCLLTYVVLPFVAPALGIAADVGPGLGITIGLVAMGSNVLTIRRFHAAQHRWRWAYTAIAVCVIVALGVLMAGDIAALVD